MFPFVIRANGKNPAMDMSSLLPAPAGRDGFVRSQGEHFVTDSGKIRFNGVNLVGPANFPEYKAADRLAERLSRLGINCVRMHFFDVSEYGSNFMEAPRPGIYREDESSSGILVEERLDRLYYLVSALKRRGIYLNMNLHVGREFDEREVRDCAELENVLKDIEKKEKKRYPLSKKHTRKKAEEFCRFLTGKYRSQLPADYVFRLPTEAELEYAFDELRTGIKYNSKLDDETLPDKGRARSEFEGLLK